MVIIFLAIITRISLYLYDSEDNSLGYLGQVAILANIIIFWSILNKIAQNYAPLVLYLALISYGVLYNLCIRDLVAFEKKTDRVAEQFALVVLICCSFDYNPYILSVILLPLIALVTLAFLQVELDYKKFDAVSGELYTD